MLASSEFVSAQKDVDAVDVLFEQQLLVGRVADEHDRLVELLGDVPGAARVAFDDLDLVGLFERQRKPHADVAAAGDDDAPHRVFETPHFAHEDAHVLAVGDEENFVAFLDHRVAVRKHCLAVAINGGDAALGIRDMILQRGDSLADQQAVAIGFRADEPHPAVGKIEHLRRTGIKNELLDMRANELFGADTDVDRYRVLFEQLVGVHVFRGANASDFRRRAKRRIGDLAGDHVGFVGVRQRDDDVRIAGAGALEYVRIGRVADDGADVEPVLKLPQDIRSHVDDGDLVGLFARQVVSRRCAHLACTEYQNFHRQ